MLKLDSVSRNFFNELLCSLLAWKRFAFSLSSVDIINLIISSVNVVVFSDVSNEDGGEPDDVYSSL